jgi:hypothetical protein
MREEILKVFLLTHLTWKVLAYSFSYSDNMPPTFADW